MQHAIGTANHIAAGLTDEEARRLEETAKAFYLRVLILANESGCSVQMAVQAVQDAMKETYRDH